MSLMSTMPEATYDAVITDPPYASGNGHICQTG